MDKKTFILARESAKQEAAKAAEGKADKVADATAGNLAGLDASGNLTDSGIAAAGEVWTFTLADGTTVTKRVLLGIAPAEAQ